MWNVKAKVIPVIIGATGTISKSFRKYVSIVPGKPEVVRLTNVLMDARANVKQQTRTVGPFQELIFSVCMCVSANECDSGTNYLR